MVVAFAGDVDLEHSPKAREVLLDRVGRGAACWSTSRASSYIDSSGIASLVEAFQSAKKQGSASGWWRRIRRPCACSSSRASTRSSAIHADARGGPRCRRLRRGRPRRCACSRASDAPAPAASKPFGYGATLLSDTPLLDRAGSRHGQVVRAAPVFAEMMEIGIRAIPIVSLLSATIGLMLALQGIDSLRQFGAEQQVVLGRRARHHARVRAADHRHPGRRDAPGSALAARLGDHDDQPRDRRAARDGHRPGALPRRAGLLAMLVMLPALVIWSDLVALARRRALRRRRARHHASAPTSRR